MTESVEWQVGQYDEQGRLIFTRDGAQSVFSKTRAEALAKKRGPDWSLFHWRTNLSPESQAKFKEAAQASGPSWGGQWAP